MKGVRWKHEKFPQSRSVSGSIFGQFETHFAHRECTSFYLPFESETIPYLRVKNENNVPLATVSIEIL